MGNEPVPNFEPEYNQSGLVDLSSDANRSQRYVLNDTMVNPVHLENRTNNLVIDISSDEEEDLLYNMRNRSEAAAVPRSGECTRQNCDLISCSNRQPIAEVGESLRIGDELNVQSGDINNIHVINATDSSTLVPKVSRRYSLPIMVPVGEQRLAQTILNGESSDRIGDRTFGNEYNFEPISSPLSSISSTFNDEQDRDSATNDQPMNLSNRLKRPGDTVMVLKTFHHYLCLIMQAIYLLIFVFVFTGIRIWKSIFIKCQR